jgi:diguanylate cyclase (GGDEF)-like protein
MLQIAPLFLLLTLLFAPFPADARPAEPARLALVERAESLVRTNPAESQRAAEQALGLLAKAPDGELELRARFVLCDSLVDQDPAAARVQIAKSLALIPKSPRLGWKSAFTLCAAQISESAGRSAIARRGYTEAIRQAEGAQDLEFLAYSLYLRGHLSGRAGDYFSGLSDLRRAHTLYAKLDKPEHRRTVTDGIASLYNRMGDFKQAKLYFQQGIAQIQASGQSRDLGIALHNLGRVHENLGEWRDARHCFERALALHQSIHYAIGMAYAHRGLASSDNGNGQPLRALRETRLAEELSHRLADARLSAQIHLQRGIALRALKRLPESMDELLQAKPIFEQALAMSEFRDTLRALAQTHADAGLWRQAYEYELASKKVSDQLLSRQIDQRLAWVKIEFDTQAKEQENALLLRENQINEVRLREEARSRKLFVIAIVLGTALLVVLSLLVLRFRGEHRNSQKMALTDELTGLPNRRAALARLTALLARDAPAPLALLIADLDHFKLINDEFGHLVGDEILQAVAGALRASVANPQVLGRLGGEEFLVVLENTGAEEALTVAERIRASIAALDASHWFADRSITTSIGVTVSAKASATPSELLSRADRALYAAKAMGRNRCEIELADNGIHAENP